MGDAYRIEPETGVVLFAGTGAFTYEGWESAVLAVLHELPRPETTRRFLSDRRRVTSVASFTTVDRILGFFRNHAEALGDMQWALVAANQTQMHEIIRLGEALTRATRVRVKAFTELDPALRWLLGAYEADEITRLHRWIDTEA